MVHCSTSSACGRIFVFRSFLCRLFSIFVWQTCLLVSAADGKVDGCKFLCLVRRRDFDIIGAPQVERAGHLAVAVCRSVILVRKRGCQVCCDTILGCKGLELIPFSGVALL